MYHRTSASGGREKSSLRRSSHSSCVACKPSSQRHPRHYREPPVLHIPPRGRTLCNYGLLPSADAAPCATSRRRVPLSRCTFLLVDVISDPCVLLDVSEFRLSPSKPHTPLLLEANCPVAFRPP